MEKLEKVIAGLECCQSDEKDCDKSCPYFKGWRQDGCLDDMMADTREVLKLMDDIRKDMWDRTNENHRLKRELKAARAERDAALEKLSWLEKQTPMDNGEYGPDFPREGM